MSEEKPELLFVESRRVAAKRKLDLVDAVKDLQALDLAPLIEKFAKAGDGCTDFIDSLADHVELQAENLVIKKAIECVLGTSPEASVRAFRSDGETPAGERTRDIKKAISDLRCCDGGAVLQCRIPNIEPCMIAFTWGNDPHEVIGDYEEGLNELIKPAIKFAESLEGCAKKDYVQIYAWRKVEVDHNGNVKRT